MSNHHTDLMRVWCGENPQDRVSLATVARLFGLGEKVGSGKDFARLLVENREAAMAYLRLDVMLTRAVARRMAR